MRLPDHYKQRTFRADLNYITEIAARQARNYTALTPIIAGVTGSTLRGVYHQDSDWDFLILVEEKIPRAITFTGTKNIEGQIQSIDRYAQLIGTSVPYVEFHRSPFTIAHSGWAPFFRALQINEREFEAHIQRFARHLAYRAHNPEKAARNLRCLWHLKQTGSPLCPRDYLYTSGNNPDIAHWVADVAPNIDPTILTHLNS